MKDERNGNVEAGVRSKELTGGCVRLGVSAGMLSDMEQMTTDELLALLHSLSRTQYNTLRVEGFTYTFPITFGE